MSRLTEKKFLANFKAIKNLSPNYVASKEELMYEKLGKLEDLEEQLGCSLEVLYKIQKKGYIYARNKKKYVNAIILNRKNKYIIVSDDELGMLNRFDVSLSNYKKTWWLKEDKSE